MTYEGEGLGQQTTHWHVLMESWPPLGQHGPGTPHEVSDIREGIPQPAAPLQVESSTQSSFPSVYPSPEGMSRLGFLLLCPLGPLDMHV